MLHIYAAPAEKERSMISERTKDALAKAKQRGVVLGNPPHCAHDRDLVPDIAALRRLDAAACVAQNPQAIGIVRCPRKSF
jgi:DNA invertase Pin-like site-specific DNA recombinase